MNVLPDSSGKTGQSTPLLRFAVACFYLAAIVAFTGVLGVLLGSVPDIHDRLGVDSEAYWNNRLQAALVLGVIGLAFGVLVNLVGAYLAGSGNPDRRFAGRVVLLVAVLPHVASIVSLLVYTPEDWSHTITHVITVALIAVGLVALHRQSAASS